MKKSRCKSPKAGGGGDNRVTAYWSAHRSQSGGCCFLWQLYSWAFWWCWVRSVTSSIMCRWVLASALDCPPPPHTHSASSIQGQALPTLGCGSQEQSESLWTHRVILHFSNGENCLIWPSRAFGSRLWIATKQSCRNPSYLLIAELLNFFCTQYPKEENLIFLFQEATAQWRVQCNLAQGYDDCWTRPKKIPVLFIYFTQLVDLVQSTYLYFSSSKCKKFPDPTRAHF